MEDFRGLQITKTEVLGFLKAWPSLHNPIILSTYKGTANTIFFVESQTTKFVLKLYNDSITTAQIQYEHSLLKYLQKADISFQVPVPIPTYSGETLHLINHQNSLLRIALIPFIEGQSANRENLIHTRVVGQTLGELHHALIGFNAQFQTPQLPSWGQLNCIHPLVKNPLEITRLLELSPSQKQEVSEILTNLMDAAPEVYEALPIQAIHGDFLCPNVLLTDNQIVGVLDFEFATSDLRLIDYTIALDHFTRIPLSAAPRWDLINAFNAGYSEHITLSQEEIEALSLVWCLQQASSIVYWTGWFLEGKITHQSVLNGIKSLLVLKDWLTGNATQLVRHLA